MTGQPNRPAHYARRMEKGYSRQVVIELVDRVGSCRRLARWLGINQDSGTVERWYRGERPTPRNQARLLAFAARLRGEGKRRA